MIRRTVVAVALLATAGIAVPATAAAPAPRAGAPAVSKPVAAQPAATWSFGKVKSTAAAPTVKGARLAFAAPAADTADITVSPSSIETYTYWSTGVEVTGTGFAPGEPVVVTDTAPSGRKLTYETVAADADGRLDHVYRTETNGAPVGVHQLRATGQRSGRIATASLTVTANALQTLRVSTSPTTISQDQFIRTPITLTAYGLAPHERLFVNLFGPDGSGQAVAGDQVLYADATGTFRYALGSATVAIPTGEWILSVIAQSGAYGSATYRVTAGKPRTSKGSLTLSPRKLSEAALRKTPLPWQISGVGGFDAMDVTISSPLGAVTPIGTVRSNGEGRYRDVLRASGSLPLGTYRMTAISRVTGNTVSGTFVLTDAAGNYPPNAALAVSPGMVTAADANTDGKGAVVLVSNAPAGSFINLSVTAPDLHFPALRDGQAPEGSMILSSTIDDDGTARIRIVFARPQPAGRYLVDVYFSGGHLSAPLVVTA